MEAIHGRKKKEWKKRENELCSAAASILSYHVILKEIGKAIIKKLYQNFNFNVPVSILTMLSLTFIARHAWHLNLMPSLLQCALQTTLPTSSGAGQIPAQPQINMSRHPAGLLDSHSRGSTATFLDKQFKKKKKIRRRYSSHQASEALATTFPFPFDPAKPTPEEDFTKYCLDSEPGNSPIVHTNIHVTT